MRAVVTPRPQPTSSTRSVAATTVSMLRRYSEKFSATTIRPRLNARQLVMCLRLCWWNLLSASVIPARLAPHEHRSVDDDLPVKECRRPSQ
mmetsp:Transcript_14974/g.48102  ORF Transcript_14974/g.48102 Transcript_14974/m.48102 type:complete len:91 (+) Transcript_14974:461-733(+)